MKFISEAYPDITLEDIEILSRQEMKNYTWDKSKDYAVISISPPGNEPEWLQLEDHIIGIIKLGFDDVDKKEDGLEPLSKIDAAAIVEFCSIVLPYADRLIVHCDAGISRSAGITAAISKYYFNNDNWVFKKKIPNMHCYVTVLRKFYQAVSIGDKSE